MVKKELIERSPLRILEKSMHGGLGVGNIGVLASEHGVGKTACLVHIATDKLFQDKHVVHVSFSNRTDHIVDWYEDIFAEIAKKRELESAVTVHDDLIKNRVIMNFNQSGVTTSTVLSSIESMIDDGNFHAEVVVVDGFDFTKASSDDVAAFKAFAEKNKLALWFSANVEKLDGGVPAELKAADSDIAVIVTLADTKAGIKLALLKDHGTIVSEDLHLILDTKTLLIAAE